MSERPERMPSHESFLRWSAIAFAIGFSVHGLDHLRRGLEASPSRVITVGTVQAVLAVLAIGLVLTEHRTAPSAAMFVGFGSALLFTYGHLLPISLDSFVSGPQTHVTWFSWVSAVAEIGTGILFAIAGVRARQRLGYKPGAL